MSYPPKNVLAVISRRNELDARANSPREFFLSGFHISPQEVGADLNTSVLETRVMYQPTAPIPLTRPSGYRLIAGGKRYL